MNEYEENTATPPRPLTSGNLGTHEKFSKKWTIGLPLLGIFIIIGAYRVESLWKELKIASSQTVTESILTNIGTAAFALVFFYIAEKKLVRTVRQDQAEAVRSAVEVIESRLTKRVEDIEASVRRNSEESEKKRQSNINGLTGAVVDFASVSRALAQADIDGALAEHSIGVPASDAPGHFVMEFALGNPSYGSSPTETPHRLKVRLHGPDSEGIGTSEQRVIEEEWNSNEGFDEVLTRLIQGARSAGLLRSRIPLNWRLALERLPSALLIADRSTDSKLPQGNIEGMAYEFVGTNWAVTTIGIENLSSDFKLRFSKDPATRFVPGCPEGTEEAEWNYLISRFQNIFLTERPPF